MKKLLLITILLLSITMTSQEKWIVPEEYETLENPTNRSDFLVIGRELYTKHCKSCHGKEGYGDGNKADGLDGDLGDFSTVKFQAQWDGPIYYKSIYGRNDMPNFEKKISDIEERWFLVNYIRTLMEY